MFSWRVCQFTPEVARISVYSLVSDRSSAAEWSWKLKITLFYSVIESEERNHVIAQENAKLISDIEKTQTTLNEIAQEHSHLLYTQARKQNRK